MDDPRSDRAQRRELREMQRRLRELDRADARARASGVDPYEAWLAQRAASARDGRDTPAPRRRRSRGVRFVLIAVAAAVLAIGSILSIRSMSAGTAARPGFPSPGVEEAKTPMGEAAPAPPGPDHYRFRSVQSGEASDPGADPVTWDPCRPIHYATSGVAPAQGQEILASAFRRLHDLTGFTLVNDGPTSEPPDHRRAAFQPERYGDRWAPILVAWTTPAEVPDLAGQTIGVGGSVAAGSPSGRATYVTGILFLDRPQIEAQLADTSIAGTPISRREQIRAVMLHEIGHIVGLDHVGDPDQLMYPVARPTLTDFAAGDLRGLHRLATGPCAPDL